MSIPKVLHYCWFGKNPKSEKMLRCMESWQTCMPGYEIKEWNEDNFDINGCRYSKSAYEQGKWAFVTDYCRAKVLYEHGGIFLDVDMLFYKPLDEALTHNAFFSMESYQLVSSGVTGAVAGLQVIKKLLDAYENIEFTTVDEVLNAPQMITKVLTDDYAYELTGNTQHLKDNIMVYSPNIMITDIGDGQCICEHLYESDVSWWDEKTKQSAGGKTWKYMVLLRYFHNFFGRPPCDVKFFSTDEAAVKEKGQTISEFLYETAPLLEQIDTLPIETATELYQMYDEAAKVATGIISGIDPQLRVQLCNERDNILERIIDDMPALNVPCKNIYTPAVRHYDRWTNTEILKDIGLVVYLLGKITGMNPVMLFGKQDEEYPYKELLPGLEVLCTDAPQDNMRVYYEHLAENYKQIDALSLYGLYPDTPEYLNMYRNLRPDGKVYLALDMNRHWMGRIPWGGELVMKAASQCDVIATSCRKMRDALNGNPQVSFPCHWITNGFYNPADIPVVADAGKKENIILTVGQIGLEQKNNLELMLAFAYAAEALPDWTLRLVGGIKEEFKPNIDEFFARFPDLKGKIVFTGAVNDKRELYKEYERAKIFALTSTFECFPNVYAEALYHGCMFVTSDIDAADEITKNGQFGLTYTLGDITTLAASLVKIASVADKAAFEKYIPQALAYADKYYDWNRIAKKLAFMMFCNA